MDLTHDALLGGRVRIWQPAQGYRAGVDPVLLAAACPAQSGDTVLDLGCGVGTAALCVNARVPGVTLTGVERHGPTADLAQRNGQEAGADMTVHTADIADLPSNLRQTSFHHVICNPPYFDRGASVSATDPKREAAMGEDTPLETWIDVAARRLRPKGWLTLIHRPERLSDLLAALSGRLGSTRVLPLVPRQDRDASLIVLQARKDGRADLRLLSPLILHRGTTHLSDAPDYTDQAAAILSRAAAISALAA